MGTVLAAGGRLRNMDSPVSTPLPPPREELAKRGAQGLSQLGHFLVTEALEPWPSCFTSQGLNSSRVTIVPPSQGVKTIKSTIFKGLKLADTKSTLYKCLLNRDESTDVRVESQECRLLRVFLDYKGM